MPPQLAASSYLLIDADTGKILVESESNTQLSPASLTKMMTSYVAAYELARGNFTLDDPVRVSESAQKRSEGTARMFLAAGTRVRLEELLRGVIIQSGNDASIAVAEHIGGSEDIFVDLMNQHAKRLGMKDTHFQNPTGLTSEDHYSSAADMATLAISLINDFPEHYKMYAEKYYEYSGVSQKNRNSLLWRDKTVDGVKTGHTDDAGYCLVASAIRDGMRLVSVVMGTRSEAARSNESQKLLAYGYRYFKTNKFYSDGESLLKVRVWGGDDDTLDLGVREDVKLTLPKGSSEDLKVTTNIEEAVMAPIKENQVVGSITIKLKDKLVYESNLVALRNVGKGGFFSGFWDAMALFFVELFGGDAIKA